MNKKYLLLTQMVFLPLLLSADLTLISSTRPPVLDGRISKGEWNGKVNRIFKTLETRNDAPDSPVLYMQYDADHIYIALDLKETAAGCSEGNIFAQPRCEIRLGNGQNIKVFAVTLDGRRKYPSDGWHAVGGRKCLEIKIPLDFLPGYRIYSGNVVKSSAKGACTLFPILKRDYNAAEFHRRFYLGSLKEIRKALAFRISLRLPR